MKKIWRLLKNHLADDFDWKLYSTVALFLAIFIFINYKIRLENGIIDRHVGEPIRVFYYFLLQSFTYFTVSFIVFYFKKTLRHFRSKDYWLITIVTLFCLSMNLGFPYLQAMSKTLSEGSFYLYYWYYGVLNNLVNFILETIPLFALAWYFERTRTRENFGVNANNVDLKPYWQILLIVLPIVVIASFEDSFRNYYPMYRKYELKSEEVSLLGKWLYAIGFEIAYGMDFFNVEFVYRGVLVIGVSQLIGKEAIIPMVASYCVLHFGKPAGECISSIFGGYILGVIAFYTRNIWGGVIVHIALAWTMEIMGFIHRATSS